MAPINRQRRKKKASSAEKAANPDKSSDKASKKPSITPSFSFQKSGIKQGNYALAGSRNEEILNYWKSMEMQEKKAMLELDEDDVLEYYSIITNGKVEVEGTPSRATVSLAQASFLHAMEANSGVVFIQETSLDFIAVLIALENRVLLKSIKRDIYKKVTLITLYFLWTSGWYISLVGFWFALMSKLEACRDIRDRCCEFVDLCVVHSSEAVQVEWQADTYVLAILLSSIASGREAYVLMGIFFMAPFLIKMVETAVSHTGEDRVALKNIRMGLSYILKILLVYYASDKYSSLFLIASLYFSDITIALITFCVMGVGIVLSYIPVLLAFLMPSSIQNRYIEWKKQAYAQWLLILVIFSIAAVSVYKTWEWEYGGVCRWFICLIVFNSIPLQLTSLLFQLILIAFTFPIHLIQVAITKVGKYVDLQQPSPVTNSPDANDEESRNKYHFDMKECQTEGSRK